MEIINILLLVLCALVTAYGLFDLSREKIISKRKKTNLSFLIILFPGVGTLVYFYIKLMTRK